MCNQAEQCMVIGSSCIWLRGDCISIPEDNNENENELCPLDIVQNMDVILLVDNSCGLNDNECMIRQQGIGKFMNSVINIDNIGYITYSKADNIDVLLSLENGNNMNNVFNVINNINNYGCNDDGSDTYSTDLAAGISVAIREFASVNVNISNRIRKLIIFSNCKDTLDTISPCVLINGLTMNPFNIQVIVVNIPCKKQLIEYE